MTFNDYIYSDKTAEQIADFKYYDKQFFVFVYSVDYVVKDSKKIDRIIKFYRLKNLDRYFNSYETIQSYMIKTNLYKNYICILDTNLKERDQLIKESINCFFTLKKEMKNKDSIISFQKTNEKEYIKRDIYAVFEEIKKQQEETIKNNAKFRKAKLLKYKTLTMALNELKERPKELFTLKLINSTEYELKEHYKSFLRWTLTHNKQEIKNAIFYILNNDSENGLNINIFDYDFINDKNAKKWQTRFYYRDLYLSLYNKYLIESNGNQETAKNKAVEEIETKHTRPKY